MASIHSVEVTTEDNAAITIREVENVVKLTVVQPVAGDAIYLEASEALELVEALSHIHERLLSKGEGD